MTATNPQSQGTEGLLALLTQTANEINRLEDEAKHLLYQLGDNAGYRDRLRQKAILLSGLAEEASLVGELPQPLDALVHERIGSFSYEAERALRVDSVFYMAVLLCPEDHKDGMPNELENLISHLHREIKGPGGKSE